MTDDYAERLRLIEWTTGPDVADQGSKADTVYVRLRAEIEDGTLPGGTGLSENALVERLGISRTPVRQALHRLLDDGLAVRDGGRGMVRVSSVSVSDVKDLFDFRALLEGTAMRHIAAAVAAGTLTPTSIAELEDELRGLSARRPSPARTAAFYVLTEAFDQAVIRLTPNHLLAKTIADLRPQTVRLRTVAHQRPARTEASMAEHALMMRAILSGKPDAAQETCVEHLRRTLEAIFAGLADSPKGSSLAL